GRRGQRPRASGKSRETSARIRRAPSRENPRRAGRRRPARTSGRYSPPAGRPDTRPCARASRPWSGDRGAVRRSYYSRRAATYNCAMDRLTCDRCGNGLLLDAPVRYEVRIEVKSAYDPLELTAEDLAKASKDLREAVEAVRKLDADQAMDEVYKE